MEGSCEHGNESSGSIKGWEVLEWLHNWRLLKKGSAPWVSEWGATVQFYLAEPRRRAIPVVSFKVALSSVHFGALTETVKLLFVIVADFALCCQSISWQSRICCYRIRRNNLIYCCRSGLYKLLDYKPNLELYGNTHFFNHDPNY
jgi:hypothetical protein